jgi:hypothetical protein
LQEGAHALRVLNVELENREPPRGTRHHLPEVSKEVVKEIVIVEWIGVVTKDDSLASIRCLDDTYINLHPNVLRGDGRRIQRPQFTKRTRNLTGTVEGMKPPEAPHRPLTVTF